MRNLSLESEMYGVVIKAVIAGSNEALKYWPSLENPNLDPSLAYEIEIKDTVGEVGNYATTADKRSEEVMRDIFESSSVTRDCNMRAEDFKNKQTGSPYTIITDGIDGTISFNNGTPIFAVLAGILYKGNPIIGVATLPVEQLVITARQGSGSQIRSFDLTKSIDLLVSTSKRLSLPNDRLFLAYDLGYRNRQEQLANLAGPIASQVNNVVSLSSSGYQNCGLVRGWYHGTFFEELKPYDMAAIVPIIREAGGIVTQLNGQPIDVRGPSSFLAARSIALHTQIMNLIQQTARYNQLFS